MQNSSDALTRRELLGAALLGGIVPRWLGEPQVRFVGDSMTRAHRVLSGATLGTTADATRRCRVLIVGAGPAGLTAAWRLRAAGVDDVLVTDLAEEPFGLLGRFRCGEFEGVPFGASNLPLPDSGDMAFQRLLAEAKAIRGFDAASRPMYAQVLSGRTQDRVMVQRNGRFAPEDRRLALPVTSSLLADGRLKGDNLKECVQVAGAKPEEIEELERWCRRECASKAADLSPPLVARALRRSLASEGWCLAPRGGPGVWFESLATALGERLRLDAVVGRLDRENGVCVAFVSDARRGTVTRVESDAILLAIPAISAMRLAQPPAASRPVDTAPESVVRFSVAIGFDQAPLPTEPSVLGYESDDDANIGGVWHPLKETTGKGLFLVRRVFPYRATGPARAKLAALYFDTAKELATETMRGLALPFQSATRFDIWRVGHGGVRPGPQGGANWVAGAQLGARVFHAGADSLGSMGLFTAVQAGVSAAETCLKELGHRSDSWSR